MRLALIKQPVSGLIGAAFGGWVPVATYQVAHTKLALNSLTFESLITPYAAIVVGGLLYSGKTVWQWGHLAFEDRWKATGFVLLIEGVMIFAEGWLARSALCYLAFINAIQSGSRLALRHEADQRRFRTGEDRERECTADVATEAEGGGGASDHSADDDGAMGRRTGREGVAAVAAAIPAALPFCEKAPSERARVLRVVGRPDSEDLYRRAVELVSSTQLCSISALQRTLNVGWPRAAKLVDRMEQEGLVGPATKAGGGRQVLIHGSARAAREQTAASVGPVDSIVPSPEPGGFDRYSPGMR